MIDPILITGCARSGTSMTAGIINACGGFGGDTFGANKNNQKGFFENKVIRQDIVKPFFKSIGADPLGQNPLPSEGRVFGIDKEFANKWRLRILDVMKAEGYQSGEWFYKGAKCCLVWYLWHQSFPKAKWIVVRRDSQDIVASCMRTSFMRAFRNVEGWQGWVREHERRILQMKLAGLQIREIWPQKIIEGNLSEIESAIAWLNLDWNEEEVVKFIAPKLWNGGK